MSHGRNIYPQRAGLRPDGRDLSIHRCSVNPATGEFYRQNQGSTIDGPQAEYLACTITGKFDPYGIRRSGSSERESDPGRAAQARYRFEVPYPTDVNGVAVDVRRGDHVVISNAARAPDFINEFRAIDVVLADGFIEVLLEWWM